jgi:hypothetical protein
MISTIEYPTLKEYVEKEVKENKGTGSNKTTSNIR